MPFTLPEGLAPEVYPLAWLVGRWRGDGVVVYPTIPEARIVQEVVVDHDGGPYLRWSSTLWLAADDGDGGGADADGGDGKGSDAEGDAEGGVGRGEPARGQLWATESGYWRVPPDRPGGLRPDQHPVELMLIDPAGHLSLYAGAVGNGRIDLASDLIARTKDAAEVNAATRLYGLVEGELLWAWDIAAFGEPLQSYASARLRRVG